MPFALTVTQVNVSCSSLFVNAYLCSAGYYRDLTNSNSVRDMIYRGVRCTHKSSLSESSDITNNCETTHITGAAEAQQRKKSQFHTNTGFSFAMTI